MPDNMLVASSPGKSARRNWRSHREILNIVPCPFASPARSPALQADPARIIRCWRSDSNPSMPVGGNSPKSLLIGAIRQHLGQYALQWSKPRLVPLPVLDSLGEYRLAHLFGARRTNGPRVVVKLEAWLLERQRTVCQQPPDLALEIGNQCFIRDSVYPPRQHIIEVPHEAHIIGVVSGNVVKIVAESLPACEMLFVQRKPAGHWMAPHVD